VTWDTVEDLRLLSLWVIAVSIMLDINAEIGCGIYVLTCLKITMMDLLQVNIGTYFSKMFHFPKQNKAQ
jgi:hypothetical protein